jgi:hypothetical protein
MVADWPGEIKHTKGGIGNHFFVNRLSATALALRPWQGRVDSGKDWTRGKGSR